MKKKFSEKTRAWIARVAEKNGVTQEEVLRYLRALSSGRKVIYHLDLVQVSACLFFLVMW